LRRFFLLSYCVPKEDFTIFLGAFRTSAIAPFSLCENACGGAPIPAALAFATLRHATP